MGHSAHSRSTVHCLGCSAPSGASSPRHPGPPCRPAPPALLARWRSRCCWWRVRLSGPDAAGTGSLVRNNTPAWLSTGGVHVSPYLDVIVVGDVFVSRCDARLDRLYPCLTQFLRLSLQHAASADTPTLHVYSPAATGCQRGCLTAHWIYWFTDFREAITYFVGDTTSKQNLLSLSSHGLTEQSLRSSTTTVRESCSCTIES